MTAYTVTATTSGATALPGIALDVTVITGQSLTQGGAGATNNATPPQVLITPAATGSLLFGAYDNQNGSNVLTGPLATTVDDFGFSDTANAIAYGFFHGASLTTASVPVTLGYTEVLTGARLSAVEIVALGGGPGLAVDATTPAIPTPLPASQVLTSASFTPPGGSLILARIAGNWNNTTAITSTASSSPTLAWTALYLDSTGGGFNLTSFWIALVPAQPSGPPVYPRPSNLAVTTSFMSGRSGAAHS